MRDTTIDTRVYRLPPKFYEDHIARGCDGGKVLKQTRSYVEVEMDRDAFDDVHSDAVYYTDEGTVGSMVESGASIGIYGLVRSACATLRRLEEVGAPDPLPAEETARREQAQAEDDARYKAWRAEQDAIRAAEKAERDAAEAARIEREDAIPTLVLSRMEHSRDPEARQPGYPDLTREDATRILDERNDRWRKKNVNNNGTGRENA